MTLADLKVHLAALGAELDRCAGLTAEAKERVPYFARAEHYARIFFDALVAATAVCPEDHELYRTPEVENLPVAVSTMRALVDHALALTRSRPPSNPNKKQFLH